jgi:hypothetical protein
MYRPTECRAILKLRAVLEDLRKELAAPLRHPAS